VREIDATDAPRAIGHAPSGDDGLVIEITAAPRSASGARASTATGCASASRTTCASGSAARRALEHRHALRGLRPVVLNGLPLLEITDVHRARLSLPLPAGERRTLRLYAIVPRPLPHPARYQITERLADRVIGGATLQLGV
jgi:hypothetical protein